jgi:TPR repeat protein
VTTQSLFLAAALSLALLAGPAAAAASAGFDEDAFFRPGREFVATRYAASIAKCKEKVAAECQRISRRLALVTTKPEREALEAGLKGGCEKGLPEACGALAWSRLHREDGRFGEILDGVKEIDKACKAGDGISCSRLVEILSKAPAPVGDRPRAKVVASEACATLGGYPCFSLAQRLVAEKEGKENDERDIALRTKACDGGDGHACLDVGQSASASNPARAAELYRKGCDLEHHQACHNLGWALRDGKGVPKNAQQGIALMETACGLGDAKACDDRAAETKQYEHYCALWGAQSCYLAAVGLTKEKGETAQVAEKLVALSMGGVRRGNQAALNVATHLFKDDELACNTDRRNADACAFAGLGYLVGWPGPDRLTQSPEAQKARALRYLRYSCDAGAKNMCAKADALQAAAK